MKMYMAMLALASFTTSAHAGIVIGGTRVIYPGEKKNVSVMVSNENSARVYLVQSWIESHAADRPAPFVVTPPLLRILPGTENMLRIVFVGGTLPQDRESLFWLNVKSIPAMDSSAMPTNALQMVIKSRLKLIYRPQELAGLAEESWQQLQVVRQGNELVISNPSAYFVSLYSLEVDDKPVNDIDIVPPKGSIHFPVDKATLVTWRAINDYGGISQMVQRRL